MLNLSANEFASSENLESHWTAPRSVHATIGAIVVLITVLSMIGNLITVNVYLKNASGLNPVIRRFVISLSISDMLSPALTNWMMIYNSFKKQPNWSLGPTACGLYGFIQGQCSLVSIVTIALITLEQCLFNPMKQNTWAQTSKQRQILTIFGSWVYCLLIAVPPLFGWSSYHPEGVMTTCCFDFLNRDGPARSFFIYLFTFGFFIPLLCIVGCYMVIWRRITADSCRLPRKKLRETVAMLNSVKSSSTRGSTSGSQQSHRMGVALVHIGENVEKNPDTDNVRDPNSPKKMSAGKCVTFRSVNLFSSPTASNNTSHEKGAEKFQSLKQVHRRQRKVITIMLSVLAAFLLAWSPYATLALFGQFGPSGITVHPYAIAAAGVLAKSSTAYNPIIFAFMDLKFRRRCEKMTIATAICVVFTYVALATLMMAPSLLTTV